MTWVEELNSLKKVWGQGRIKYTSLDPWADLRTQLRAAFGYWAILEIVHAQLELLLGRGLNVGMRDLIHCVAWEMVAVRTELQRVKCRISTMTSAVALGSDRQFRRKFHVSLVSKAWESTEDGNEVGVEKVPSTLDSKTLVR